MTRFPQVLKIMEPWKITQKKFHAWRGEDAD